MHESVTWHKSSYGGNANPNCVECRTSDGDVLLRDSRHPTLGHLAFPEPEWAAFLAAAKHREL